MAKPSSFKIKALLRFFPVVVILIREVLSFRKYTHLSPDDRLPSALPRRLAHTLLSLGPAFVKLGQILSSRPDFIPEEYVKELSRFHENVPPFSFEKVRERIQEDFGQDIEELFSSFDKTPAAAASLAQVHFATLPDGAQVAVKVQRPRIVEDILRDMTILGWFVGLVRILIPKISRNIDLWSAFQEFKIYTLKELDFELEGKTLERFRNNFRDWEEIRFPAPYPNLTSKSVLTMEKVGGLRLHEIPKKMSTRTRQQTATRMIEFQMKMFIQDSFFHADLHPGNIFFGEDGHIAVIDVGMHGSLTREQRDHFLLYWLAVSGEDKSRAFIYIQKMMTETKDADVESFWEEFNHILDQFYINTISERSWTKTYMEILISASRHGFRVPSELLLEAKALTTAEALSFVLAPDLRFNEIARPIVVKEVAKFADSHSIRKRLEKTLPDWLILGEVTKLDNSTLSDKTDYSDLWEEVGRLWAEEVRDHRLNGTEVIHGSHTVVIEENIEKVFNFISRFASYELWHPTYTEESRVIHVAGDYMFLSPEVVGSVFRIDEIADGFHVQSNGVVTEFERNRHFKWRAPLSLLPAIYIGTAFDYRDLGGNRTEVREDFYYLKHDLLQVYMDTLTQMPGMASLQALKEHIREELDGIKQLIESGETAPQDFEYLWEGVDRPIRVAPNYLRSVNFAPGPRVHPGR